MDDQQKEDTTRLDGTISGDRDHKGRFAPGNPGGPGRKPLRKELELLLRMRSTVTPDEWQAAVVAILESAKSGDVKAFEALAKYLIPTPEKRVGIRHRDGKFRAAGASREQIDAAMVERLQHLLEGLSGGEKSKSHCETLISEDQPAD